MSYEEEMPDYPEPTPPQDDMETTSSLDEETSPMTLATFQSMSHEEQIHVWEMITQTKKDTTEILSKLDETADPKEDDPLQETMDQILALLSKAMTDVGELKSESRDVKSMLQQLVDQVA
ncbi:hypothetical protein [Sulfitobacter sp. HGT1]|uniref:hypothetical protein n=1 Tax=Sulfitobacter sp. HGT1 TaxID=2735435 RepID=UPI0015946D07|nr:hypothetical protein [Sulfitobacter sp. HGT1]